MTDDAGRGSPPGIESNRALPRRRVLAPPSHSGSCMTDQPVYCASCRRLDRWGGCYCGYCGHDLLRACTACGTSNTATNYFCIGCGESFAAEPVAEPVAEFEFDFSLGRAAANSGRYSVVRGKIRTPEL